MSNAMSKVLSACAVRAAIQQETADNERHYLGAILVRLKAYYEIVEEPNIREQVSDEIDFLEELLGLTE